MRDRREMLSLFAAVAAAGLSVAPNVRAAESARAPFSPRLGARSRVVYLNDLSGDVDGLFSAVHMLLSPSVSVRAVIGTSPGSESAQSSADRATEILSLIGRQGQVPVFAGAEKPLLDDKTPDHSAGVQAIIDEAVRTDTSLPLFVAVGGGLTEVASALMLRPEIASKFTLVWIGGGAYPSGGQNETNFGIDRTAARFIFNNTVVPIWQVPQNAYAQCVVSDTELQAYVAPYGAIGAWLYGKIDELSNQLGTRFRANTGETWTLGDSPLVSLTALTDWVPSFRDKKFNYDRTGSSEFDELFAPTLNPDGTYTARTGGRKIRVYKTIDTRLMLADFYAKLKMNFERT